MIVPKSLPIGQQVNASTDTLDPRNTAKGRPIAELFTEINALAIRLKQGARAIPGGRANLPGAEDAVMDILDRVGPLTVPKIARERCTSRQNIQILVDRLETQRHVELVGNPAHKRSALVCLTEQGKACLHAGETAQKELLLEIESSLSEFEIKKAVSLLRKIHGLLSGQKQIPNASPMLAGGRSVKKLVAQKETEEEEFPVNLL